MADQVFVYDPGLPLSSEEQMDRHSKGAKKFKAEVVKLLLEIY